MNNWFDMTPYTSALSVLISLSSADCQEIVRLLCGLSASHQRVLLLESEFSPPHWSNCGSSFVVVIVVVLVVQLTLENYHNVF